MTSQTLLSLALLLLLAATVAAFHVTAPQHTRRRMSIRDNPAMEAMPRIIAGTGDTPVATADCGGGDHHHHHHRHQSAATAVHASQLPNILNHRPEINEVGCDMAAWRHSFVNGQETATPTTLQFVASPNSDGTDNSDLHSRSDKSSEFDIHAIIGNMMTSMVQAMAKQLFPRTFQPPTLESLGALRYSTKSWMDEYLVPHLFDPSKITLPGSSKSWLSTNKAAADQDAASLEAALSAALSADLPEDFPSGTWFRNGAGRFSAADGQRVAHPFDGDGMIMGVTFDKTQTNNDNNSNSSNGDDTNEEQTQADHQQSRITFRNKFVKTQKFNQDQRTGTVSMRGLFGTQKSGGFLANIGNMDIANVANTNCVLAPGTNTLYALWEGGKPYALDPVTLDMKQEDEVDMGGMLNKDDSISAHYRYDPIKNTYVTFGTTLPGMGKDENKIHLYEYDTDTYQPKAADDNAADDNAADDSDPRVCITLPGRAMMHDFILTENYVVFTWVKAALDPLRTMKALLGFGAISDSLTIPQDSETTLLVVPRSLMSASAHEGVKVDKDGDICIDALADDRITRIELPFRFNFHFGNAYEADGDDGDRHLTFDMIRTSEDKDFDFAIHSSNDSNKPVWETLQAPDVEVGDMARYTVNLDAKQLQQDPIILCDQCPEFPVVPKHISSRPHRYTYTTASRKKTPSFLSKPMWGAQSAITKIDATTPGKYEAWAFDSDEFVGEPTMVRKQGADPDKEDACYVMTTVSKVSTGTTDIAIMDVEGEGALERGPICRLRLPEFLPNAGLHGGFFEGAVYDFD